MDNGDMYLIIRNTVIHLSKTDDSSYRVAGKYRFRMNGDENHLIISGLIPTGEPKAFYFYYRKRFFRFEFPG